MNISIKPRKGIKFAFVLLISIIAAVAFILCGKSEAKAADDYTLRVMLKTGEGVICTSQNPVDVFPGSDVSFNVSFDENYNPSYLSLSAGEYENGVITVKNVRYPMTVTAKAENREPSVQLYTVKLVCGDGISSDIYEINTKEGKEASFNLSFEDGYEYLSSTGGAVYGEGTLTVFDVKDNTVINVIASYKKECALSVSYGKGGSIENFPGGAVRAGDVVELFAVPEEGYIFKGWTVGAYIAKGGVLVSASSQYSFVAGEDVFLYANFTEIAKEEKAYTVRLIPGEHVDCRKKEVEISAGDFAVFTLIFDENWTYLSNDAGAEYANGILLIRDVRADITVTVNAKRLIYYNISVKTQSGGIVSGAGRAAEGALIKLNARPDEGYEFVGWSSGDFLLNGGSLISEDAVLDVGASADMLFFANFKSEKTAIIRYHANGGSIAGQTGEVMYKTFSLAVYLYPNLIPDDGTIYRDGYSLTEYTTGKYGGGEAFNPGGKLFAYEGGIVDVWAQWSKWSDASLFEVKEKNTPGKVYIINYKGNEDTLSIPAKINGREVEGIAAGAVKYKDFFTLVIPSSVIYIEPGAFYECRNFDYFYICDKVRQVSDSIFDSCRAPSHFYLNAATYPYFPTETYYSHFRRLERLIWVKRHTDNPTLVFLGGSSMLYGTSTVLMQDLMAQGGYDFTVVNYGHNASSNPLLYMEVMLNFLEEGDVLVHGPEITAYQLGDYSINTVVITGNECCYNIYRYADMSKYTGYLNALQSYNTARFKESNPRSYEDYAVNYNQYVEMSFAMPLKTDDYYGKSTMTPTGTEVTADRARHMNEMYDAYAAKGIRQYKTFAPMNANAVKSTDTQLQAYENAFRTMYKAPVIQSIFECVFEPRYMWDSDYHLGDEGRAIRTRRMAAGLIARFKAEEAAKNN